MSIPERQCMLAPPAMQYPISGSVKTPGPRRRPRPAARPSAYWIYGRHAAAAALANPGRRIRRVLASAGAPPGVRAETAAASEIAALLPPGAVHQGLAALAEPLGPAPLGPALAAPPGPAVAVALDRVSDPRNLGAVLRSAAGFGAAAVIVPGRRAPPESGALAKAASGALERVPVARPANLVRALAAARRAGFWTVGLDAAAPEALGEAALPERCLLVLGAEGRGLRRLTREACDLMVRIPVDAATESLNVSACAAVALYEWARRTAIMAPTGREAAPRSRE